MARMRVLWIIDWKQSTSPGAIAHVLGVSKPTATELVDGLARAGYVSRRPSSRDRRQVVLTLRAKGRAVIAKFARSRREKFQRLALVVDAGDVRRLAEALEAVNAILAKGAP